ncbi:MAG TPA: acyl-CoA dehydrogenase family protein [Solirubrobacteraceae bacterium]|nr:acyl-CoA dehydrogenase family protein [Solirubrobacteraceae bacterium]
MASGGKLAERGMAVGLRALNRVASSEALDRLGLRDHAVRAVAGAGRNGTRAATSTSRRFAAAQRRLPSPARQRSGAQPSALFDLTPTEEQQLLRDSVNDFAMQRIRPAGAAADDAIGVSHDLLAQANELGLTMLGVPEQLGGIVDERSATTSVLVAEVLARGDMGIAVACLAPAAVSTAMALWGDAEQQARYLPPFVSDDVPAASLALMEPGALADPMSPAATAIKAPDGGYVLDGVKSLVPRAADAELFVIGARLGDRGPALFVVQAGTDGLSVASDPGMGVRAAATGRLQLRDVRLPADALLGGDGAQAAYRDCVALSRLGWCAVALGAGRAVLDYVSEYVRERHAFGEPIADRQAVAFAVANIAIELEGLRLATLRAAARVDAGLEFHREVALARRLCAVHGMAIGSDGVQLLGGHGYVKEHPVERWYRDLRAAGMLEGGLLV